MKNCRRGRVERDSGEGRGKIKVFGYESVQVDLSG